MALGPAQLSAFRKREATEASKRGAKTGSQLCIYKAIAGVQIEIYTDQGTQGDGKLKITGIERAVKMITDKGFALPTLRFILTGADGVENVAFMGDSAGQRAAVVYLGPKIGQQNKKHLTQGVSDAVYDGTQRFFGNPKQTAMVTTVVIHELAHVLHELTAEDQFWTNHEAATMASPLVWGMAAAKVSQYAQKLPLEFVAEAFTGIMVGKKYDQEVKVCYRALGGPEVPGFFT